MKGGLGELVKRVAPGLTGLSPEQLEAVGCVLVDADSGETVVNADAVPRSATGGDVSHPW